jgi:cell division septal protein FtsQ
MIFTKRKKDLNPIKKSNLKSQAFVEKENWERSRVASKIIFKFLCVIFVSVVVYIVFFSPFMQVTKFEISGNQELATEELRSQSESIFNGTYLGFIPKNNYILFPTGKIILSLKDKFKKINEVETTKTFPDTFLLKITERKSLLVWCVKDDDCYLMDENGIAYNKVDFSAPEVVQNHLIKVSDLSSEGIYVGEKVITDEYLKYLMGISDQLKSQVDISIGEQYATPTAVSEEIDVSTQEGTRILFSTQFPLENAVKGLKIFLQKRPQSKLSEFEYIDLRSENKIFYKLKNAPAENSQV